MNPNSMSTQYPHLKCAEAALDRSGGGIEKQYKAHLGSQRMWINLRFFSSSSFDRDVTKGGQNAWKSRRDGTIFKVKWGPPLQSLNVRPTSGKKNTI